MPDPNFLDDFFGAGLTPAGDLDGSSTDQSVVGIQGIPVAATAPTIGQSLKFNGTHYAPASNDLPFLNVKDYGLTGDGTTPDDAALNTMLTNAAGSAPNGFVLYFPAGTYNLQVASFLITTPNVEICGDGRATVLKSGVTGAAHGSGTAATISAKSGGKLTLTGLAGMTPGNVNNPFVMSGWATSANNGAFYVTDYISSSSVKIFNSDGVQADANNGAGHWADSTKGTLFICNSEAPAYLHDFEILLTSTGACTGIQLVETRAVTLVENVTIYCNHTTNLSTGIVVRANRVYAGGVRLSKCAILGTNIGVDLDNTVTTTSLFKCSITGNSPPPGTGTIGVNHADRGCNGNAVLMCEIDNWDTGLKVRGTNSYIAGNYFEANTTQIDVAKGVGSKIWTHIAGNLYSGAGAVAIDTTSAYAVYQNDIGNDIHHPGNTYVNKLFCSEISGNGSTVQVDESVTVLNGNTHPATTGGVRLTNADGVYARDHLNGYNFRLIGSDSTDSVLVGSSNNALVELIGTTSATLRAGGVGSFAAFIDHVELGLASVATAGSGLIRTPNAFSIGAKRGLGAGDVTIVALSSGDVITWGEATNTVGQVFNVKTAGTYAFEVASVAELTVGTGFWTVGAAASAASSGSMRVNATWSLVGKSATSGNVPIIALDGADNVEIGGATVAANVYASAKTGGSFYVAIGGVASFDGVANAIRIYGSDGSTAAASNLRLPKLATSHCKSSLGNYDIGLFLVDSSDNIQLGDANSGALNLRGYPTVTLSPAGTGFVTAYSDHLAIGANSGYAASGTIRLTKHDTIVVPNNAVNGVITVAGTDSSDRLLLGDPTSCAGLLLAFKEVVAPGTPAADSWNFYVDSTTHNLCAKGPSGTVTVIAVP